MKNRSLYCIFSIIVSFSAYSMEIAQFNVAPVPEKICTEIEVDTEYQDIKNQLISIFKSRYVKKRLLLKINEFYSLLQKNNVNINSLIFFKQEIIADRKMHTLFKMNGLLDDVKSSTLEDIHKKLGLHYYLENNFLTQ